MAAKFETLYTNAKGGKVFKTFSSETAMESWLTKHAVSVYAKGAAGCIQAKSSGLNGPP